MEGMGEAEIEIWLTFCLRPYSCVCVCVNVRVVLSWEYDIQHQITIFWFKLW